ncbi:hypothetical protein Tco_0180819 [Tanacetum coccineum]
MNVFGLLSESGWVVTMMGLRMPGFRTFRLGGVESEHTCGGGGVVCRREGQGEICVFGRWLTMQEVSAALGLLRSRAAGLDYSRDSIWSLSLSVISLLLTAPYVVRTAGEQTKHIREDTSTGPIPAKLAASGSVQRHMALVASTARRTVAFRPVLRSLM